MQKINTVYLTKINLLYDCHISDYQYMWTLQHIHYDNKLQWKLFKYNQRTYNKYNKGKT